MYSAISEDRTELRVKVVVSLLGDEDEMVKVWKVGGPGECQVRITHSKKGSLLSRSEV